MIPATWVIAAAFAVLGAILASFLGVIAERVHTGQSWRRGRSRCNSCRRALRARDLLPVASWALSRGRCRRCGSRIPARYALFELALGGCFAAAYLALGPGLPLALFLAALAALGFIVLYDLRHMVVPLAPAGLLILLAGAFAALDSADLAAWLLRAIAALGVALFFVALHLFSRGRAMGLGDAPIAFALALLTGSAAFAGLLFSFWVGAAVGIAILATRRGGPTMGIEVPFVPFLAAGYLLAYFTAWNPLPF